MAVGLGKGVGVISGVCEAVTGRGASVAVDWLEGEQAQSPVRSASSNEIGFIA